MRGREGSLRGAARLLLATLVLCLALAASAGAHPGHTASDSTRFQSEEPHGSGANGVVIAATLVSLLVAGGGLAALKRRPAR